MTGSIGLGKERNDAPTSGGFGFEWRYFDQTGRPTDSLRRSFAAYFSIFPWADVPPGAVGLDVGCGTGRWASLVCEQSRRVVCIDAASDAIVVAARNKRGDAHLQAYAGTLPFPDAQFDFAFSLGVLHHIPDTEGALAEIVRVVRPGAPVLIYVYYALDNRPRWFRSVWRLTDVSRQAISRSPERVRLWVTSAIAACVYLPLARVSRALARCGRSVGAIPLNAYRDQPFYVMRTDALDRFGTVLEKRYTGAEVRSLLEGAGLIGVMVSDDQPFWCALGRKPVTPDRDGSAATRS